MNDFQALCFDGVDTELEQDAAMIHEYEEEEDEK